MANTLAPDADRLPWLTDEKVPSKAHSRWWLLPPAVTFVVAVAAIAFWFGTMRTQPAAEAPRSMNEVTAELPVSVAPQAQPVVEPAPMPDARPAPLPAPVFVRQQREVRLAAAQSERRATRRADKSEVRRTPTKAATTKASEQKTLAFSNPWESADASGRMVRVGTYSTLRQGKQAWSRLARVYPAMKRLPAVVTDLPSKRNGRVYYRLQIGTTSQAHSEVLCQRMKAIGQSCVVVDLAGAQRGIGDERQPIDI